MPTFRKNAVNCEEVRVYRVPERKTAVTTRPVSGLGELDPQWIELDGNSILGGLSQTIQVSGFLGLFGNAGDRMLWFFAFADDTVEFVSGHQATNPGGVQSDTLSHVHTQHVDGMTLMVVQGERLPNMTSIQVTVTSTTIETIGFGHVWGRFDSAMVETAVSTLLSGVADTVSLESGTAIYAVAVLGTTATSASIPGETDVAVLVDTTTGGTLAMRVIGYKGDNATVAATDGTALRYAFGATVGTGPGPRGDASEHGKRTRLWSARFRIGG